MNELVWKSVIGHPMYEISNTGIVRYKEGLKLHPNCKPFKHIKITGFGYKQVILDGMTKSIHNLVADAFIGTSPGKRYRVDHIDGDKLNNSPENLRWIPHSVNVKLGKYSGNRTYFYEGELWLIKRLISFKVKYLVIANMFKCSTMLIQDVKKGLKDKHLKSPKVAEV